MIDYFNKRANISDVDVPDRIGLLIIYMGASKNIFILIKHIWQYRPSVASCKESFDYFETEVHTSSIQRPYICLLAFNHRNMKKITSSY